MTATPPASARPHPSWDRALGWAAGEAERLLARDLPHLHATGLPIVYGLQAALTPHCCELLPV